MASANELPEDPATAVRFLLRRAVKAVLATGSQKDGWAFASLVTIACSQDGAPILLLSELASHTRNLAADPRGSLLVDGTDGYANPQEGPRVTVMGRIRKAHDTNAGARFLARHPAAELYAGFKDFAFYRMTLARAHFVGGFARAHALNGNKVGFEPRAAARIGECEADVLRHMNEDHADALALYGNVLLGQRGRHWHMVGVDGDGCDLRSGKRLYRLDFAHRVENVEQVRAELVRLADDARSRRGD